MNLDASKTPILDDETFFNRLKLSNLPQDMKSTIINNYNKLLNETQLKSILYLGLKNSLLINHEENDLPTEFISTLDEKRMDYLNDFEIDINIQGNVTTFKIISKFEESILK